MANTGSAKINISDLDFDSIKLSLQNYLSSQSFLTDYDFAGSGLQVILNLLAYNDFYLAFYLNMVANEMFLDSADRRENIVSIAKTLGYTPRSRKSAMAIVNLTITPPLSPPPPAKLTIDKNTRFNSSLNNQAFTFVTTQATTLDYDSVNNRYVAANLVISEGVPYTFKYTVNTTVKQRFLIPNNGVDTKSIVVRVQGSVQSSLLTTYIPAADINLLDGTSAVYFLQEVESELYEVYFGDGVLGAALTDGNIVYIDYLNCNADASNFCNKFTLASSIGGFSNVVITTVNPASGGAEREDPESVRFSAPKNYVAQNRAVTVEDYKTLIARDYPNVDSVAIWGGQDNVPPQPGKVFLSLKPVSGFVITNLTKQTIINDVLSPINMVSVIPTIIDPEFIFIKVNSLVKYDAQATINTPDDIGALVLTTINNFAVSDVGKFDRVFRYSKLTRQIDGTEPSITNDLTTIQMQKRFAPSLVTSNQYAITFGNAIIPGTLSSTAFVDTSDPSFVSGDQYFFDDDGNGTVRTYKFIGTTKKYTKSNSGVIDYSGTVTLTNFRPSDVIDSAKVLRITVNPVSNDIVPVRNNIIIIESADVTVNVQANAPVIF